MSIESLLSELEHNKRCEVSAFSPRTITIRIPGEDVALSQAIADYYRVSRASFVSSICAEALNDVFCALPHEDRKSIADAANQIYVDEMTKLAESDGKGSKFFQSGLSKWQAIDELLRREEQKQEQAA